MFNKKIASTTSAVMLLLSCLPLRAAAAIDLSLISSKKAALKVPGYERLTSGDGPTTNDGMATPIVTPNGVINPDDAAFSAQLKPLTLHDQEDVVDEAISKSDTQDGGVLKSTVSTTDYVSKQDNNSEMQPRSLKGVADPKVLVKQASKVGLGPVQLTESEEETNKKVDTILTAEQVQLNDLWEATLTRSPDIQFIVQKLQPTSNQAHLSTILTRMLSTAAFGGLGAMAMVSPNMGMYAATSAGGSIISQVLGMKESSNAKKAKLSQEEQLVMFNMVRNTCDKLVGSYRDYKKNSLSLERASNDLQDLKSMVSDARSGQDAAKQLEMEYTLRKQERDIDGVAQEVRRHRQSLVDLAGPEAIDKLDKELVEERNQLHDTTVVANGAKPQESSANVEAEKISSQSNVSESSPKNEQTNSEIASKQVNLSEDKVAEPGNEIKQTSAGAINSAPRSQTTSPGSQSKETASAPNNPPS